MFKKTKQAFIDPLGVSVHWCCCDYIYTISVSVSLILEAVIADTTLYNETNKKKKKLVK